MESRPKFRLSVTTPGYARGNMAAMPRAANPRRGRHFFRAWREYRGLSRKELAQRLNTSAANLGRIERMQQGYSQEFLEACANVLRTDPASLLMLDPGDAEGIWSIWDAAKPHWLPGHETKPVPNVWKRKRRPHFIQAWREHRGLTPEQLADLVGTSPANVCRIETLRDGYTQNFLEACADALKTDPASLIGRHPDG